jgi:hypothetical protein
LCDWAISQQVGRSADVATVLLVLVLVLGVAMYHHSYLSRRQLVRVALLLLLQVLALQKFMLAMMTLSLEIAAWYRYRSNHRC